MSPPLAAAAQHDVGRGEYRIWTDRQRFDIALIHEFLRPDVYSKVA